MTREIAEVEGAIQASPYDDADVIAGNGVGGLEIVRELRSQHRSLSHFVCAVSGGGLMAGHALSIADAFPHASIIGVEPSDADDFRQSLAGGRRIRIEHPTSICDGLLSYEVGRHNWPILSQLVADSVCVSDRQTCAAMKWIVDRHGVRTEPSGAITIAARAVSAMDIRPIALVANRSVRQRNVRRSQRRIFAMVVCKTEGTPLADATR